MSKHVEPALTSEEWEVVADALKARADGYDTAVEFAGSGPAEAARRLRTVVDAIRAGQPFGFTREDVDLLEDYATDVDEMYAEEGGYWLLDRITAINALADRIAALLPPEEE